MNNKKKQHLGQSLVYAQAEKERDGGGGRYFGFPELYHPILSADQN